MGLLADHRATEIVNAIQQIESSQYYKYGDEAPLRSVVDVLLRGRPEHLKDMNANNRLTSLRG
jgi:hypothetical protein